LRLKILKKLRTASLHSEFTGSYKKSVVQLKMTLVNVSKRSATLFKLLMAHCWSL